MIDEKEIYKHVNKETLQEARRIAYEQYIIHKKALEHSKELLDLYNTLLKQKEKEAQ